MQQKKEFNASEIDAFRPDEKIGLVASINPEGQPHITLITSIQAASPTQMTLGQFCKGSSKAHIQQNPNIAFLVMTLDRKMWRGRATWTHLRQDGPEYEAYNNQPMFRYNTYFGINTVHYLDLVETGSAESLPLVKIIAATLATKLAKAGAAIGSRQRILKPFAEDLFNRLDALKFIAYIGDDGFPVIVPLIQCQAADSGRLSFSPLAFGDELKRIASGTEVAVFGLTMAMEDVLVRGRFQGFGRTRLVKMGTVDIDWVYNSMPPCHGQIYPEVPLRPIEAF
jgi:hypothetical protein